MLLRHPCTRFSPFSFLPPSYHSYLHTQFPESLLEQLLHYIMGHTDVWFATCAEIVEDWQKQQGKGVASQA